MRIEGTIPPMVTPTTGRTGGPDPDATRRLTAWLVERGVDALFPCGSTGEFASLTDEGRRAVVEATVDAADGTPVLAGCGGTSIANVVGRIEDAAAVGADAAVVVTPYYLPASAAGHREFYDAVIERSPLPILLYTIPQFSGERLPVETVADLASRDAVVGIKDSSGDLDYVARLVAETPDGFAVLQGSTQYAVASLDVGADGVVPGHANFAPESLVDVTDRYAAGDRDGAVAAMAESVWPASRALADAPVLPALKYLAGRALGESLGPPLAPLPELTAAQRDRLDRLSL